MVCPLTPGDFCALELSPWDCITPAPSSSGSQVALDDGLHHQEMKGKEWDRDSDMYSS